MVVIVLSYNLLAQTRVCYVVIVSMRTAYSEMISVDQGL